jgi:hypothetical protein
VTRPGTARVQAPVVIDCPAVLDLKGPEKEHTDKMLSESLPRAVR